MAKKKNSRMTKAEGQAFAARWELVNAHEERELQQTTGLQKLRQLAALMASADLLDGTEVRDAEDEEVRRRWQRLRRAYGV